MSTPYEKLYVGMQAEATRLCTEDDLFVFARASGNLNPLHLPNQDGNGDGQLEAIAPGMWIASFISAVLGNQLPGPGSLFKEQHLRFHKTANAGETLTAKVEVLEKLDNEEVVLSCSVINQLGELLVEGKCRLVAPKFEVKVDQENVPYLILKKHRHFTKLIEQAEKLPNFETAVVCPEEADSLKGAMLAYQHNLIKPVLIGNEEKIRSTAKEIGVSLDGLEIFDTREKRDAAMLAVQMIRDKRVSAIMKGHLHTDVLLKAVVNSSSGLKTDRRLSHVFVMDVTGLDNPLLITDAAINIAPDLRTKVDIVQNAIDLALAIGIEQPRVGVLSAVETVNPAIASTLDAAALSKMADRGQIKNALVDGPLAMDNAINIQAAKTKGIHSLVAGRANILLGPNLEASNMLAKELTYLGNTDAGGIVLGAKCPIILTSRSDSDYSRLASCALASLYANYYKD